jgi:hypothetical protein
VGDVGIEPTTLPTLACRDALNQKKIPPEKKTIMNMVPIKGRGYVRVHVAKVENSFIMDLLEFVPYQIIHKYWGLGFGNVNINDFIFYEFHYTTDNTKFHYTTDNTKFRGCIKR